jgi:hypothetical protein
MSAALNWQSDAYLVRIKFQLKERSNLRVPSHPDYYFQSPSQDYQSLTVSCGNYGAQSRRWNHDTDRPIRHFTPFTPDDAAFDSQTAIDIASPLSVGRCSLHSDAVVFLSLSRDYVEYPDRLIWSAWCSRLAGEFISIWMDATTGEVIEIR